MIEKYRKIIINILICIPAIVSLFYVDKWILPKEKINDKIILYSTISVNNRRNLSNSYKSSKIYLCTKFFTQKGLEFSIEKGFINENQIIIKRSYIFNSITSVKSQSEDYTNKLTSGLNGASLYSTIGLTLTSIISILMLKFNKKMSKNSFLNIILVNSFLIICTLYIITIYN